MALFINISSYEPCHEKTGLQGFPTRSDTKRAVQPQKMTRGWKFWDLGRRWIVLSILCSENKGADQLRDYHTADMRLCFRIYAKSRFSHEVAQLAKNLEYIVSRGVWT